MKVYGPHVPVLLSEVLESLNLAEGNIAVDGTLGQGGYTSELLTLVGPTGQVVSFDLDREAIANAQTRFAAEIGEGRLHLLNQPFDAWERMTEATQGAQPHAFVLDLGLSTHHLTHAQRGFSFGEDAPLDMRFGDDLDRPTAADVLGSQSEEELADIFYQFGELRNARVLAKEVVAARPLVRTTDLVEAAMRAKRGAERRERYLAKVFQAVRIAVNDELGVLERALNTAMHQLAPGGRIAVVSYHSLEDRLVKQLFQEASRDCVCPPESPICTCDTTPSIKVITSSPRTPSEEEVHTNPKARSAKLRVAERLTPTSRH